jgi:hypothetical protein
MSEKISIAIASEHEAYELKEKIKSEFEKKGYCLTDLGANSDQPIDYPYRLRQARSPVSGRPCAQTLLWLKCQGNTMTRMCCAWASGSPEPGLPMKLSMSS